MNIRLVGTALAALLFTASAASADFSGQARVIDGDTFSIRQQRIRIAAIDACERDQAGFKNGAIWRCGIEARRFLASLIDGKHVRCIKSIETSTNALSASASSMARILALKW